MKMNKFPLISIIIPCFNAELYISNTISSIKKQSYPCVEVIFVDDGSKDKTVSKINEAMKNTKITFEVLQQKNKGTSIARNNGIKACKGEWFVCIDSDDVIHPEFLTRLYFGAMKFDTLISLSNFRIVSDTNLFSFADQDFISKCYSRNEIMKLFLKRKINVVITAMLLHKDTVVKNGLLYSPEVTFGEDAIYIWRVLAFFEAVSYEEYPLYNYYVRQNSKTTNPSLTGMVSHKKAFVELADIIAPVQGMKFAQHAYARAVFALIRVSAMYCSYEDFCIRVSTLYDDKIRKQLLFFPDIRVKILTILLNCNLKLFYMINHIK
ncbi:MAG: glycosyltransferase [Clostridiales bacterium]|nr:glycosyltransferase [Clostridiales bacterium]